MADFVNETLDDNFLLRRGRESVCYSGKSSQQRLGIHSRRRHAPETRVPL
jgi:hypothetical protein